MIQMSALFRFQAQALMHAEAVLLIDDDQGERGKLDVFLKQGMGAGLTMDACPSRIP